MRQNIYRLPLPITFIKNNELKNHKRKLNRKAIKKLITVLKILLIKKGAVFILAFFRYVVDCTITDRPPNEHIALAIGKAMDENSCSLNNFNPLVHSNPPKTTLFESVGFLVIIDNKFINGDNIFKFIKISVKR